jgi:hypothetical protein
MLSLAKVFKKFQQTAKTVYGDRTLKRTQMCEIIKKVKMVKSAADQRHLNTQRQARSTAFDAVTVTGMSL